MDKQLLRILVVSKDAQWRQFVVDKLRDVTPYLVDVAGGLKEAWEKIESCGQRHNILLINEALGDEQEPVGLDLVSNINALYSQATTLVFTEPGSEWAEGALRAGAFRCLAKQIDPDELLLVVDQAAEHQRLKAAARERQLLERLMENSAALLAMHNQQQVFDSVLEGVRAIGFDRVCLYLLSEDRRCLVGKAAVGVGEQFSGTKVPLGDDSHAALFMTDPRPRVLNQEEGITLSDPAEAAAGNGGQRLYAPLFLRGELFGLLTADNHVSNRFIDQEQVAPVALLASQAAAAIDNARVFEQAERRAKALDTALRVSMTINSSLHLDEILSTTCRAAVELFDVSHSGLVLFTADNQKGHVVAEYPELGTTGLEIPLAGAPAEDDLVRTGQPLVIADLERDTRLGQVGETMRGLGIRSTLIVPVVSKDKLIGSFGLDTIGGPRVFTDEEIELCRLFAAQVAVAIENARLFKKINSQAERLEALRETSLAITSEKKPDAILLAIINEAVRLLEAYSGGIYRYNAKRGDLTIIADNKRKTKIGKTLPLGIGLAGNLVMTGAPFIKDDNYEESLYKTDIFDEEGPFGAVLQVPLEWKDEIIGVLYIEDPKRREFTDEDVEMLRLFADQAAIALENAELIASDSERLTKLEKLSRITREIMANLGETPLDERLQLIAMHTADILDAEACGIHLVKRPGSLSLEASYGHAEGGFPKGRELAIVSGPRSGLTGFIAHEGKLFNSCGDELINHPAIRGDSPPHAPSRYMYSLIAMPLRKREGQEESIVGLLRADNKRGRDGHAHPRVCFTREDEWIIEILAKAVVIAIDNARLVEELDREREHLDRLIDSSPNGLVAVDAQMRITRFNHRAEEVLGYSASEVLNKSITRLYSAPVEARKTRRALVNSTKGQVKNYLTSLKSKDGDVIPIRVSATWLSAEEGRIGAVGYFEDLRSIAEEEHKRELLLKASSVVAHTENLTKGLNSLAEMIAKFLKHTFCRILLLDQSGHYLVVRAAHPIPRKAEGLQWNPGLDRLTALSDWPGLRPTLEEGRYRVLRLKVDGERDVLKSLSKDLGLDKPIQSLMVIPLKMANRLVGMLEVAEMRNEQRAGFTADKVELATSIADQATLLIDRLRSHEFSERLQQSARKMSEAFTIDEVLRIIASETKDILRGSSSTIWPYDEGLDRFLPGGLVAEGVTDEYLEEFRSIDPQRNGITYAVKDKGWLAIRDTDKSEESFFLASKRRDLLRRMRVKSFQGHRLTVGQETLAVLYVNYDQSMQLGEEDKRLMKDLADRAALALKRVQLLDQINRTRMAARVVASATARGGLKDTLCQIAEGVKRTAGCDVVTLYVYNPLIDRCDHPATMVGVRDERAASQFEARPDSIVYELLNRDEPYIVEDVDDVEVIRRSRFAREEQIKSLIAVPLKLVDQRVGVMFVNYRTWHRFTVDEKANIDLLADQAAIAILFEVLHLRLREQEGLQTFSEKLLGALDKQQVLDCAAAAAKRLLNADCAGIELRNERGDLMPEAAVGWEPIAAGEAWTEAGGESQSAFTIKRREPVVVDDYSAERRFAVPQVVHDNRIKSGLSVPMFIGEIFMGAMLVYSRTPRRFTGAEQKLLSLVANQTTIALKNMEQIEINKRKIDTLTTLYNAAKAITASFKSDQEKVLDEIIHQAVECVIRNKARKRGLGTLQLYDKDSNTLLFKSYYPMNMDVDLKSKIGTKRVLEGDQIGITGRAVLTATPQKERDVRTSEDYYEFHPGTRSELAVPLLEKDGAIGVISLESEEEAAFDDDDQLTLRALAELAIIAMQSGRRYRELEETRNMVVAQTALAWMGMASSVWGHSISGNVLSIRDQVTLINDGLRKAILTPKTRKILDNKLKTIESLAVEVLDRPILQPLSSSAGVSDFHMNELIEERTAQLWRNEPYKSVELRLELADDSHVIRGSREWIRRALDIIVDNAVKVMKGRSERKLTIRTGLADGGVRVEVRDTGPGIAPDVLPQLFKGQVKKSADGKGLGVGLMMANAIIQAYSGKLDVAATGPQGTTLVIWMPLAR